MKRTRTKKNPTDPMQRWRDRLRIDPENLDEELVEHPVLYERVASAHAISMSDRDAHKEYLKQIEGRISNDARESLSGEKKPTVDQVKQAAASNTEWQKERATYLELCKQVDLWLALKEAYQARGYALHNLSGVYVARMAAEAGKSE